MEQNDFLDKVFRHKVKIVFGLLVAVIAYVLFSYSLISIEVTSGASNGKYIYQITNQKDNKTTSISSDSYKITKLVPKSSYEVLVNNGDKSFFSVVRTKSFLSKTNISVSLGQEKARSFIGNNPEFCMYYSGILYSYECGGSFNEITIHNPATNTTPTTATENKAKLELDGSIEGFVKTAEGDFTIVGFGGEKSSSSYVAYPVNGGIKNTGGINLGDLKDGIYKFQAYKNGFLAYNESFNRVLYYSSINIKPEEINIKKPDNSALESHLLSVRGDAITALYSNNKEGDIADLDEQSKSKDIKNEVVVRTASGSNNYTFNGSSYSAATLCAEKMLCLLSDDKLFVYDIGSGKAKHKYDITGVKAIENTSGGFLVVKDKQIINLNAANQSGFVDYSLDDYKFCGLQSSTNGYLMCLINNKNKKVALYINQSANNTDSIDKKVEQLQKQSYVSDVSIYGNYIFVSPNAGELKYIESIGGYDYDPAAISAASNNINQEITKLGIDRSKYTIINTLQ